MIAALVLAFFGTVAVRAQDVPVQGAVLDRAQIEESLEIRARRYLGMNEGKRDARDYRDEAIDVLGKKGIEIADFHRVEFPGIFAGGDDTSDKFPDLFDGRAPSSQVGLPTSETVLPQWAQSLEHPIEDLSGLIDDSGGKISKYAEAAIAQYKKKEIAEIVAHSWGAEVVYNAIFLGKIRPPKRLILAGVTETNWAKWKALSAYTGTEIVVYDNKLDYWAQSGRGLHAADNTAYRFQMSEDTSRLEDMWQTACRNIACNEHNRDGKFSRKAYVGAPTHNRYTYYQKMIDDGALTQDIAARQSAQSEIIDAEAERMFLEAMGKARKILRESDAMKQSFINGQNRRTADQKFSDSLQQGMIEATQKRQWQDAEKHRILIENLSASVLALRGFAASACRDSGSVSQSNLDEFRRSMFFLGNYGAAEGYVTQTVLSGLGACENGIINELFSRSDAYNYISEVRSLTQRIWSQLHPVVVRPPREPIEIEPHKKQCGQSEGGDPGWCTEE